MIARRAVIVGLAVALAATAPLAARQDEPGGGPRERKLEDVPRLTVRGEAKLERPADQARLRIAVTTEDAEAARALDANSKRMKDVVAALRKTGIEESEYETGRFRIRPVYDRRPPGVREFTPQIVGYEIVNGITVKTTRLELIGEIIAACNKAGANTVEVESFDLADPRLYRREAIAEATRHALEDAAAVAEAAGLRLVRIVAVNLDHTPVRPAEIAVSAHARALAEAAPAAPPIQPGDVVVEANVVIIFEIAGAEPSTP